MNIKIPVAVAIKRIETRIKEIKKAQKENEKIKKENEEGYNSVLEAARKYVIANISTLNVEIHQHWRDDASVSFSVPRPAILKFERKSFVNVPCGNLADLERALGLLKITSSTDVNLKSVKGLAEMV